MDNGFYRRWFEDTTCFDPARDGKIPLRCGPLSLIARMVWILAKLGLSRHPGDAWLWIRSMWHRRRPLSLALPWYTFDAIRALQERVGPGTRVFEYGAGHSTLFWLARGAEVYAVEDDREWYQRIIARLTTTQAGRIFLATENNDYIRALEKIPGLFDLIVVDGSYRKACIDAALSRVRPGGVLVVDNTDWHWFDPNEGLVPINWPRQVFSGCAPFIGHLSETSLWIHPIMPKLSR